MSSPTAPGPLPVQRHTETEWSPLAQLEYDIQSFEFQQRRAKLFAASKLVPEVFQGEKGIPNILIGMEMANRLRLPLLAVLQSIMVIHGKPGWVGTFMVALINKSEKYGPLEYKFTQLGKKKWRQLEFDDFGCQVVTRLKGGGGEVVGPMITMEMAHKDGWVKNDKYASMPETMLQWRAVSFFARFHCPEITLGLPTAEELEATPRAGHKTYSSEPDPRRPKIVTEKVEPIEDELGSIDIPSDAAPEGAQPPDAPEPEVKEEEHVPRPRRPKIPIEQLE